MDTAEACSSGSPEKAEATAYLTSLLNRSLHVHISDGRMFVGQLKCTDNERNLILAMTQEYRQPTQSDIEKATAKHVQSGATGNVKVDMRKRFVGLIVIPGRYIDKIELESFKTSVASAARTLILTLWPAAFSVHRPRSTAILDDPAAREQALLRKLTEARVACANSHHEFNTLSGLIDEWRAADKNLEATALDIHLHCESGAKEADTILDILTTFLTEASAPDWQWMEATIRQENAAGAVNAIIGLVNDLASANTDPEVELKEITRRAEHIKAKMDPLKGMLQHLHSEILREAQLQQEQTQAKDVDCA